MFADIWVDICFVRAISAFVNLTFTSVEFMYISFRRIVTGQVAHSANYLNIISIYCISRRVCCLYGIQYAQRIYKYNGNKKIKNDTHKMYPSASMQNRSCNEAIRYHRRL